MDEEAKKELEEIRKRLEALELRTPFYVIPYYPVPYYVPCPYPPYSPYVITCGNDTGGNT